MTQTLPQQGSLKLSGHEETKDSLDHFQARIEDYHASVRMGTFVVKDGARFSATPSEDVAEAVDLVGSLPTPGSTFTFDDGERKGIVLTPHTYARLLSTLGVRHKWFQQSSAEEIVEEISKRDYLLSTQMFKVVAVGDGLAARGLVSKSYTSIDDTEVVAAIRSKYPTGVKVNGAGSYKTHETMNLTMLSRSTFSMPGSRVRIRTATVVRNSEVGSTSLWVIPALCIGEHSAPVMFRKKALLQRSHRGSTMDMRKALSSALDEASLFHELVVSKLHLLSYEIGTVSDVLDFLDALHLRFKASKALTLEFKNGFKRYDKTHGKATYSLFDALDSVVVTMGSTPKGERVSSTADLAGALFAHALTL